MQLTCPCCATRFPLEAGFAEDDGKRLAALLADVDPVLGRALLDYLRLFKPGKQQLRSARAFRIASDLLALVDAGSVCRDERGGVRRPADARVWARGIELMLTDHAKLTLPLANHNYLRSVVYNLADSADARAERAKEAALRTQPRVNAKPQELNLALHDALNRIRTDRVLGLIDDAELAKRIAAAKQQHGGARA